MHKISGLLAIGLIGAGPILLGALQPVAAQTLPRFGAAPAPAAAAAAPSAPAAVPAPPPPPAAIPAVSPAKQPCNNPDALGIGRVVEIDTTGGPGFGFEHFKQMDFLRDKEVVLTFDDGPWPENTPSVLKTLANECTTGLFFPIGKHATWHPEILKQVAAAGHTIGSHTWSHANLNNKKLTEQQAKEEIEKGISAVRWALGGPEAPFFRFPALQHPPAMVTYLGERNVGIWSCDLDSFDFKASKPETVITTVFNKLNKLGKGIILMHDFQKHTAEALPALLRRLKTEGYKVVQVKAKEPIKTLPQYDEALVKEAALPTMTSKPVSAVVRDVTE
jgi:peptidoglycan/xylan/chitin deacetylase (PgdA/CDA1 family)